MRILHFLNHSERLSGNVHAAVDLACAQARAGNSVAFVSRGGDFDDLLRSCGVEIFKVEIRRTLRCLLSAELCLRRVFVEWRPDVVHAHMMTSAVLAFPICQIRRLPLVTTVHNAFEWGAIFMALGRRIVAVSAPVSELLKRRGFPQRRVRIVLNGTIGSARLPCEAFASMNLHHPAILFVGGLHARKGVKDLIAAFAMLTHDASPHLYIVGEGPSADEYKLMTRDRGISDRVTFLGAQVDPRIAMRSADIFVLPSLADPAPLVISEAREAGCAIVATSVDGIPDMLEGGSAGLLVPPASPRHLADALQSLLSNPTRLGLWRKNSQINIDRLKMTRVVEETQNVYIDALYPRRRIALNPIGRRRSAAAPLSR